MLWWGRWYCVDCKKGDADEEDEEEESRKRYRGLATNDQRRGGELEDTDQ
jgi:hypothetical protein